MNKTDLRLRPRQTLEGRKNFKRFVVIARDGTVTERIGLHITDMRVRETVICQHYLITLVRHVLKEDTGVRIVGRDAPWDFQIELSNGSAFGVEIVSIADNQQHFTINSLEDRRDELARQQQITLRQLKKIALQFPDPLLEQLIAESAQARKGPDGLIDNPDFLEAGSEGPARIYVSYGDPVSAPLSMRLADAVARKAAKRADKSRLVLIIDNRTSLDSAEPLLEAAATIEDTLEASPFREIWLYTGYYSDFDGNNSEYSFIPLKLDVAMWEILTAEWGGATT